MNHTPTPAISNEMRSLLDDCYCALLAVDFQMYPGGQELIDAVSAMLTRLKEED